MLHGAVQFVMQHEVAAAALGWYLWQVLAQALPDPLPNERWYRALYTAAQEIAFNHEKTAATRAAAAGGRPNA